MVHFDVGLGKKHYESFSLIGGLMIDEGFVVSM